MFLSSLLRSQLGKPTGRFGSLVTGPWLNLANARLMALSVDLLGPGPNDQVLDVGFGGGYTLFELAKRITTGHIAGVDYSHEMVTAAAAQITQRGLGNKVSVQWGDVSELPLPDASFDKVLSVSSLYYWPNLAKGIGEIARVTKPGGRTVLGFRSGRSLRMLPFTWHNFGLYEPEQVAELMRQSGFTVTQVEHRDQGRIPDMVAIAGQRLP